MSAAFSVSGERHHVGLRRFLNSERQPRSSRRIARAAAIAAAIAHMLTYELVMANNGPRLPVIFAIQQIAVRHALEADVRACVFMLQ
jgi:hypothetical protein